MSDAKKPGPKRCYTQRMLEAAVEEVLRADPFGEVKERLVVAALNELFELDYKPRAGSLQPEIDEVLAALSEAETRRLIAALPDAVLKAADEEAERAKYATLATMAHAHRALQQHALVPLQNAEQEMQRLRSAFDRERAARLAGEELTLEAQQRATHAETALTEAQVEREKLAARVQQLTAENKGLKSAVMPEEKMAQLLEKILSSQRGRETT